MCDTEAGYEGIETTELVALKAENARIRDILSELVDIVDAAHDEGNYKDRIDSFTTQPAKQALKGGK